MAVFVFLKVTSHSIFCLYKVKAMCICGNRTATVICSENEKEHQRIRTSQLASKMADIKAGNSVDIKDIFCPVTRVSK